jgi:hypothetical protein
MILLTLIDAPGATDPAACAETVPLLVAQLDRATLDAVVRVVAAAVVAHATAADALGEWEHDGPP